MKTHAAGHVTMTIITGHLAVPHALEAVTMLFNTTRNVELHKSVCQTHGAVKNISECGTIHGTEEDSCSQTRTDNIYWTAQGCSKMRCRTYARY